MTSVRLGYCILIVVGCVLFLSLLFYAGFFSSVQLKLGDSLYGGKNALSGIVIVAIDDKSLQELGRWPWDRNVFAAAIKNLGESKTIGIDVAFFEGSDAENDAALGEAVREAGNVVVPIEFTSFEIIGGKAVGKELLEPIPELEGAYFGYVNIATDSDGISRAVNTDLSLEYDSFAQKVYKVYWGKELEEKSSRFLVNFVGPPGSYQYYSLSDVVNERVPGEDFAGKLVLIGATSPDMHDDYFVPTSRGKAMPGVEIHANTVQTMINKDFLRAQGKLSVVLLMLFFGLVVGVVAYFYRVKWASAVALALIVAYLFAAIFSFNYGVIANIVFVPLAVVLCYTGEVVYFYSSEKEGKKQIKNAFSKYVASEVVEELVKNPEKLKLGGERKEITVFFSDIRDFTSISEKLKAEELAGLLNEYLSVMTGIVLKHKGVVDKFIGDAVMAFWGAPLAQPKHAERACDTSLEMLEALRELNKGFKEKGLPELRIGIGLNTGNAVIGNLGSYDRFDYTAIGDNINLGSRLEGLTKEYGVEVIVSGSTQEKVKDLYVFRKLDLVKVKGKKKPVEIYELVGRKESVSEKELEEIRVYENGLGLYLERKWSAALKEFSKLEDKASRAFVERCKAYKKSPPEKDWDGAWTMKSK